MAIKAFNTYFLDPIEAYKVQQAYLKTKQMIGTVTREQVRNMYLEKKYHVSNPEKPLEQAFPESAPRVSVAPVSEFKM